MLSEQLPGASETAGRGGQAERHGACGTRFVVQNDRHRVAQTTIGDDVGHRPERRNQDGQGVRAYIPQGPACTAPLGFTVRLPGSKIEAYMRT